MLVYRYRKTLLRFFLTYDVLVEKPFYVPRLRKCRPRRSAFRLLVIIDDLVTAINELVANVNAGTGDQFLDIILRLAAKRATQKFFWSAEICHKELSAVSCQLAVGPNVTNHLTFCRSQRQTSIARRVRPV